MNVVAFDPVPCKQLLDLQEGDVVSIVGPLTPKVWTAASKVPATPPWMLWPTEYWPSQPKYTAQNLLKALFCQSKPTRKSPWIEAIQGLLNWSAWRDWTPPTPCTPCKCATRLRYTPKLRIIEGKNPQFYKLAKFMWRRASIPCILRWRGRSPPGGQAIGTNSPVRGLRPGRGAFSRTWKLPSPESLTSSPRTKL